MAVANAAVHADFKMNCRNLRLWRKAVCFGFAENQEKRVNAAHRCFRRIVKLRVSVTVLSQFVHTLRRARAQIIEPPEHDRFSRTNFCACRNETALLSIVAKGAFECAAGIGQRLRSPVDYAKRTRDDAVAAAVANVILHEHRTDFGAKDCAGGTRFKTTSFLAMLANIREENPAKRVLRLAEAPADRSPSSTTNECEPTIWPPFCRSCSTNITCRQVDAPRWPVLS